MRKPSDSSNQRKSSSAGFDPFNNRLSRDIRNSLSEAIVEALSLSDKSPFLNMAARWQADNLDDVFVTYIQDRLKRYDQAFDQIYIHRIGDTRLQTLILWNQQLFFEVHELLEQIWRRTTGDEREALKGLIQAAGVYVHLEYRHRSAAEKLAGKSADRIQKFSEYLTFIGNLNELLIKLKSLDNSPPQLLINPPCS